MIVDAMVVAVMAFLGEDEAQALKVTLKRTRQHSSGSASESASAVARGLGAQG